MSAVKGGFFQRVKTYAKDNILSKKEKENIKKAAAKIHNFIIENKSLLFFGLTIVFSYYLAPASAFKYLTEMGVSLKTTFLTGTFLATIVLAIKEIFFIDKNNKPNLKKMPNNDKINYLIGLSNICQTLISPIAGLVYATGTTGFMLIKTAYVIFSKKEEEKKEKKVMFLLHKDLVKTDEL